MVIVLFFRYFFKKMDAGVLGRKSKIREVLIKEKRLGAYEKLVLRNICWPEFRYGDSDEENPTVDISPPLTPPLKKRIKTST